MKKSKLGYKRYSPDVNNPYNIIPSGRITMRDVDFPVYGIDDMGNAQMMYPGGEYQFPGNQVFELPIKQEGGERDPEMMFRDKYNTLLKPIEERKFNRWAAKESKRQGRDILMDMGAYDVRGFWKSGDYKRMDQDNHGSDTWKKPNHPTFSNQSRYHGADGWYGGNWTDEGGYQPSKQTLQMYGPDYYQWMFGTEPNRSEHLDMSRYKSGVNAPTPLYYKKGGELPMAQVGGAPQPFIRPDFFTPEQIRKARIDAAKDRPLTFEGRVNKALGNPKEKAADLAQAVAPRGEGPVDNVRHTVAGMYTADAIANKLSPYPIGPVAVVPKIAGFMGSNLAGLAHEAKTFIPSLEGDYRNIPTVARMSAEDIVNNFVGSALSLNPFMTQGEKEELIVRLSNENYLPDGYEQMNPEHSKDLYFKKEYGGDLEEFGSGGLKQWFAEKWVDVKTGKECGRSGKDKNGRPYPACRPSRRVNSTTPKTTSEMSSSEKAKFKSVKTSGQRIPYNHKRKQMGGFMMPEGLSPAFFTGMKDAVVDAFKSFMVSPEKPETKSVQTDWTKMKRPDQIKYGIDQIVALEPEDKRKSLENLLEATAYMENRYGADPRAYGRNYTSSFMSIDPIALKDMFTGRGNKGVYNAAQRAQIENFKRLNLPTDKKQFDARLRKDDPVAAMAAARYRYAMVPQALPDVNNPQQMFDYWLKYYNGQGVLKHQTREQAYKEFLKGYKMAMAND